jgi:Ni,Fe-hydrogenase I large subunit
VGHWTDIKGKKIKRYQVIAGTTWNATPKDDSGIRGVIEEALIGVPVPDLKKPINVVRTVRSYDPCLACTVHMLMPGGKKYSVQVT